MSKVPGDDKHTVHIKIEGKDPMALRFITSDNKIGQVFDLHYGSYVHTIIVSPSGKKIQVCESKLRPVSQPRENGDE